ncbi:hypothetical protein [Enterococcus aquimarinus]|uniref:Uncharacterized protein n=1 Tax=Enterococcus aquimarinus TaxID=328396 RepID=A0A1L8QT79_9ENTE|nr:hypothetical protein [Enterococcus aquimarinus]OJG10712.1 hypothetical protein RU93_GL001925 [Enterococcus aquimarinus]
MKIEHHAILKEMEKGTIGKLTFSRYDVATGIAHERHLELILKEALQFLLQCHQSNLETLFASCEPDHQVYLITMQFQNQSLSNLLIDGSPSNNQHFKKQIELVSTNGLYQFNSADPRGFSSTFIQPGNYQPEYDEASLENIWLSNILYQIQDSITKNQIIYLGGTGT